MTNMSAQEREARIKQLEGCRDDWETMIRNNEEVIRRLDTLKNAGHEFGNAIDRATKAGEELAAAKSNIEATIQRVRSGGR